MAKSFEFPFHEAQANNSLAFDYILSTLNLPSQENEMNTHGPLPLVPEYNQLKALVGDKPAHITGRSLEALPFAFNFMRKKRRVKFP